MKVIFLDDVPNVARAGEIRKLPMATAGTSSYRKG